MWRQKHGCTYQKQLTYISLTASPTPQNLASSSMPSSLMTVLSTSKQTASALLKSSCVSASVVMVLWKEKRPEWDPHSDPTGFSTVMASCGRHQVTWNSPVLCWFTMKSVFFFSELSPSCSGCLFSSGAANTFIHWSIYVRTALHQRSLYRVKTNIVGVPEKRYVKQPANIKKEREKGW